MGRGRTLYDVDLGVHTIAYHKDFLGWIPSRRKYVAPRNTTQTITLEQLAWFGSENYLMAQIPIGDSDTDFYTVEARLFAGYDDGIPGEAVVIHKVDTTRVDRLAQVLDIDNNGDPNDEGAMWTPGEIFTDLANGIQVSVNAEYATGFQVTINTNPATITTCIDFLSASHHLFGLDRDNASVQVEATSACDWSAKSNAEWIHVTSGGGSGPGSVSYTVAANASPNARTGTLIIGGWTFTVTQAGANDVLFKDDMESGVNGWDKDKDALWTLTAASSRSGTHAWTHLGISDEEGSEDGYEVDRNVGLYSPIIDLTEVTSATLTFWHRYDFGKYGLGELWMLPDNGGALRFGGRFLNGGQGLKSFTDASSGWEQTSINLTPFVGQSIQIAFTWFPSARRTDGWTIDDVAIFSSDFVTREPSPAFLENPQPASFQSGIGVISGWACEARKILIELDGTPLQAAYGTVREDTWSVCGDTNNGFSLLWNWNNLGVGTHTVRALIDGEEFANTTVRVTTFGEQFLRGTSGTFELSNFPVSGETTVVRWEESLQNFVITDGHPNTGEGYNRRVARGPVLENPSLGSSQSGIGVISGWACDALEIIIELDGTPLQAAYGTVREDTRSVCGDTNNGFSLLWNWNNLGEGEHTVRALINGAEFANTTVRVTTFGEQFLRGVSGMFPIPDFPRPGETKKIQWEQSLQNFVIIP